MAGTNGVIARRSVAAITSRVDATGHPPGDRVATDGVGDALPVRRDPAELHAAWCRIDPLLPTAD